MTIHHEYHDFIVQNDTEIVDNSIYEASDANVSSSVTVRTVTLPPLGFLPTLPSLPPIEDVATSLPDLATNVAIPALDQLVMAALESLPLWFLIGKFMIKLIQKFSISFSGGVWALITSLSVPSLRNELSSLSFLFMPQSNSLAITQSAVDQGLKDLDAALAAVFMGIKVKIFSIDTNLYKHCLD